MKKLTLTAFLVSAMFASNYAHGSWSYEGKTGPEYWGELSPKYQMCKIGKNQSPIDITKPIKANLKPLKIDYDTKAKSFLNNGHTLKAEMKPGSYLEVDGKRFELLQFHFHTPSENKIEGNHYPMEAHFVHSTKDGNLP